MKQTAVEFLVNEFKQKLMGNNLPEWVEKIIEQAKAMEKEQIKQVVIGTYLDLKMKNHSLPHGLEYYNLLAKTEEESEQYYNETFKSE